MSFGLVQDLVLTGFCRAPILDLIAQFCAYLRKVSTMSHFSAFANSASLLGGWSVLADLLALPFGAVSPIEGYSLSSALSRGAIITWRSRFQAVTLSVSVYGRRSHEGKLWTVQIVTKMTVINAGETEVVSQTSVIENMGADVLAALEPCDLVRSFARFLRLGALCMDGLQTMKGQAADCACDAVRVGIDRGLIFALSSGAGRVFGGRFTVNPKLAVLRLWLTVGCVGGVVSV